VAGDATLDLYVMAGWGDQNVAQTVGVHESLSVWNEIDTNWTNLPGPYGLIGPALDVQPVAWGPTGPNSSRYVSWTIPGSIVQSWIDDPADNMGLVLVTQTTAPKQDLGFFSREGDEVPRLSFEFLDVPCDLISVADGNWNDPATWDSGVVVPMVGCNTTAANHAIAVTGAAASGSLLLSHADGSVSVGEGHTLAITGAAGVAAGRLSIGPAATVSVGGEFRMQPGSIYRSESGDAGNGTLQIAGDAYLGGTLEIEPLNVDPTQVGTTFTEILVDTDPGGVIHEPFASVPPWGTVIDRRAGHLGFGVFNMGVTHVPADPPTDPATYSRVTADVYVATQGDANGDGTVDVQDINAVITRFSTPADPSGRTWLDGDTAGGRAERGDGFVDGQDIGAVLENFDSPDPGPASIASATAEYNPSTGEFSVSVDSVMSWALVSPGQFTGPGLASIDESLPDGPGTLISANVNTVGEGGFGGTLSYGDVSLGQLAEAGTAADQFQLEYVAGFGSAPQVGTINVVPEPGTTVLLLTATVAALTAWLARRRRTG